MKECDRAGNRFRLGCKTEGVSQNGYFTVKTNKGIFASESLVIATGGLSIPQIGATGFGYDVAKQFGLAIVEPRPALDGFNLTEKDLHRFSTLSGVAIDVIASCNGAAFRENILFTHNGLSGPASLQASLYWQKPMPLEMNLLPEVDPATWLIQKRLERSRSHLKNVLAEVLPKRFAEQFCDYYGFKENLSDLSDKRLHQIADSLRAWQLFPDGTVGFKRQKLPGVVLILTNYPQRRWNPKK